MSVIVRIDTHVGLVKNGIGSDGGEGRSKEKLLGDGVGVVGGSCTGVLDLAGSNLFPELPAAEQATAGSRAVEVTCGTTGVLEDTTLSNCNSDLAVGGDVHGLHHLLDTDGVDGHLNDGNLLVQVGSDSSQVGDDRVTVVVDGGLALESSQHTLVDTLLDVDVHGHGLGSASSHPEAILELVLLETGTLDSNRGAAITAKGNNEGVGLDSLATDNHVLTVHLSALDHANGHVGGVDTPHGLLNHPRLPVRREHGNVCVTGLDSNTLQVLHCHGHLDLSTDQVGSTVGADGHRLR
ncbi:hypothetical protein PtrSN002B_003771 [Pyrenophora tritici-repentis]|nr:hypothetical protein PtrV1_03878 [Pyrenophora tritici-repentis]KAF7451561.1 hypothetical protein A1F99_033380 [Pyrenophora tritici-repentis]KAG9385920.1 hypothetical protein A1F94_002670 [Pyrenophora tritici-repentis]KAI1541910.1 hypothetical protein PtrSN001A_003654 [Pyrenophora tritici-repentis]KAI1544314.1 hypothetical protein PtrSN001C_003567 [Pyrenophora tritici-repentis]